MAIGAVIKYNQLESILFGDAGRQWDNATAGSCMFCLADETYPPDITDTTTTDVGAALITAGDGAPVNVTTPALDKTTTPGTTYYDADPADFGDPVTIDAKYLICVQPVTAGTFSATTSKLVWFADLNVGQPTPSIVSITRSGTTATATFSSAHGITGTARLLFAGATQADYNIEADVTVIDTTTVTYQVANSPATPATGTPTATYKLGGPYKVSVLLNAFVINPPTNGWFKTV